MGDKEIVMNLICRAVDNIVAGSPLAWFSASVKNYLCGLVEPYIDLFMEGKHFNSDMASAFLKKEATEKIENFKKQFKEEVVNENNN